MIFTRILTSWSNIADSMKFNIQEFLISLNAQVYNLINAGYKIFLSIANVSLFSDNNVGQFIKKIYALLAIIVIFIVAYSLLTYIVDPDKNKDGQSTKKMAINIATSFLMIVVAPFLFNLSVRLQNIVLNKGVISNLFDGDVSEDVSSNGGNKIAFSTFSSFFYSTKLDDSSLTIQHKDYSDYDSSSFWAIYDTEGNLLLDCEEGTNTDAEYSECTFANAKSVAEKYNTFEPYKWFSVKILDGNINFSWFVGLISGAYLAYIIIGFCFDVAIRLCKLFFYEILSPLCIACRIIPKKDAVFKEWWKGLYSTYLSIFIKVFVMQLGIWIISTYCTNNIDGQLSGSNFLLLMTRAFLIIGIVTFIKQAPDLLCKIFGFDDVKLGGLKDKWKAAGIGALAGAAYTKTKKGISGLVGFGSGIHANKGNGFAASVFGGINNAKANYKAGNFSGNAAARANAQNLSGMGKVGAGAIIGSMIRQQFGTSPKIDKIDENIKNGQYSVTKDQNGNSIYAFGKDNKLVVNSKDQGFDATIVFEKNNDGTIAKDEKGHNVIKKEYKDFVTLLSDGSYDLQYNEVQDLLKLDSDQLTAKNAKISQEISLLKNINDKQSAVMDAIESEGLKGKYNDIKSNSKDLVYTYVKGKTKEGKPIYSTKSLNGLSINMIDKELDTWIKEGFVSGQDADRLLAAVGKEKKAMKGRMLEYEINECKDNKNENVYAAIQALERSITTAVNSGYSEYQNQIIDYYDASIASSKKITFDNDFDNYTKDNKSSYNAKVQSSYNNTQSIESAKTINEAKDKLDAAAKASSEYLNIKKADVTATTYRGGSNGGSGGNK